MYWVFLWKEANSSTSATAEQKLNYMIDVSWGHCNLLWWQVEGRGGRVYHGHCTNVNRTYCWVIINIGYLLLAASSSRAECVTPIQIYSRPQKGGREGDDKKKNPSARTSDTGTVSFSTLLSLSLSFFLFILILNSPGSISFQRSWRKRYQRYHFVAINLCFSVHYQ
jgi:hypothetical protein